MVIAHGKSDEGHEDAHIFRSYDHLTTYHQNDSSIRNPGPADALEIGTRDLRERGLHYSSIHKKPNPRS
jgi:hypothetical protein